MADNYHFDLSCTPLEESLKIAFHNSPSRKVSHWLSDFRDGKHPRLLLAWSGSAGKNFHPLPSPLDAGEAIELVKGWLRERDYGQEPDHDGDNGKSWRIYNQKWGHVAGNFYVFCAIEPEWAEYGK